MIRWIPAAIAALLLFGIDARTVGLIADGRQMIFTAVAITETGSLGQARSRDLTVPRPGGDSVSRYGLAMSLAQVPAAALAPSIEERNGPGTSQWIFLVAPFVFVIACSIVAAAAVRRLGGGVPAQLSAILLSTLASPFGSYAAVELSEPLQALALTASFAAAIRSRAVLAGLCAGVAVLTKSSLLLVVPLTALPLLLVPRDRLARVAGRWAMGFAPVAAVWLYFEIARFGHPLAGYAGEGFTHPFVDGAWRLLIGVNKGLLLYCPAAIVACVALVRAMRGDRARAITLSGAVLPAVALWLLAAPWWAWHGVDGWGPRLIVPGIPLLAIAASVEMERWRPIWRRALIVFSMLLNLPPLLQHPTPVVRYVWANAWPVVDARTAAGVPAFARHERDGKTIIPPDQVLSTVPSASPFVLLPWFYRAAHADPRIRAERLNSPPWLGARPDIRPSPPLTADEADVVTHRSFAVYNAALADQIMRAQQLRQGDRALALAQKLERLAPSGFADALLLESYRLLKRKQDAVDWLQHLPMDRRTHPAINVVLALWDRDDGREEEARALLQSSAPSYPGMPVQRALTAPLSEWPADFASMTADPSLEVRR